MIFCKSIFFYTHTTLPFFSHFSNCFNISHYLLFLFQKDTDMRDGGIWPFCFPIYKNYIYIYNLKVDFSWARFPLGLNGYKVHKRWTPKVLSLIGSKLIRHVLRRLKRKLEKRGKNLEINFFVPLQSYQLYSFILCGTKYGLVSKKVQLEKMEFKFSPKSV